MVEATSSSFGYIYEAVSIRVNPLLAGLMAKHPSKYQASNSAGEEGRGVRMTALNFSRRLYMNFLNL
jgi:hypothetical protein